jgi:hypothetical protein
LPRNALEQQGDLLEVAADFHQQAALSWLFHGAAPPDRERFAIFALKHHLADALLLAVRERLLL